MRRRFVVSLIQASQPTDPSIPVVKGKLIPFLSVADLDDGSQKLIKLDLPFEPTKAATFDSGEFLVLGADKANMQPVLALLHEDGTVKKMLDLDGRSYVSSRALDQIYAQGGKDPGTTGVQRMILGALNNAQLVPWGSQVLLVQPGSTLPVYRFRNSGQVASVTVKLPDGLGLDTVLGSGEGGQLGSHRKGHRFLPKSGERRSGGERGGVHL